jgi:hypothetical protein
MVVLISLLSSQTFNRGHEVNLALEEFLVRNFISLSYLLLFLILYILLLLYMLILFERNLFLSLVCLLLLLI